MRRRHESALRGVLAAAAAGAILSGNITAGEWPQFRGPTGQGIADIEASALPLTWSESDNVRWKVPVEGLHGGRQKQTAAVEGELGEPVAEEQPVEAAADKPAEPPKPPVASQSLEALCLDAETGAELWRVKLFEQSAGADLHDKNSHASPTPLIAEGKVYVHFGPHGTACLTTDGEVVWKNSELTYGPRHGTGSSPALAGDVLIVPCDGIDTQQVYGLEKSTGEIRWKVERNSNPSHGFSFCTPLVIEVNGRMQAISPGSGAVVAYDPATGEELWRARYGAGYSVVPRPVYAHGLVYICTGFGTSKLMAIDPAGAGDVTETHVKWETEKNVPKSPSLLIVGDELYMVSDQGVATCLNALTGEQIGAARLGGNYSASPLYVDGRIYFQDENGTAIVVEASPEFTELGRSTWGDGGRTFASYAVADGALFLRSETHVYRVEQSVKQTGG